MQIVIEYKSIWQNSFLNGSNDEPLPKNREGKTVGRKFDASSRALGRNKKQEQKLKEQERPITIHTVMGVLNRLIRERRKLYQAREAADYYFKDIEKKVTFENKQRVKTKETVFIHNNNGNYDPSGFSGCINDTHPSFTSDYSKEFWSVLWLEWDDLCQFIIDPTVSVPAQDSTPHPVAICYRFAELKKRSKKAKDSAFYASDALDALQKEFGVKGKVIFKDGKKVRGAGVYEEKEQLKPMAFYCSALYLQLERLAKRYDMTTAKTKQGCISGISKNGFDLKEFMGTYSTKGKKRALGNPYPALTKADGKLIINIDIDEDKGTELSTLIEKAGVQRFTLGKKGLARLIKVDPRPVVDPSTFVF